MHSFSSTTTIRAAWLALIAMVLIVVAPLISITLQNNAASKNMGLMHHDMPEMASHGMENNAPQTAHIDHAEACGYCVLLTHVPGLILLAIVMAFGWLRQHVVRRAVSVEPLWLFTLWSRPHTRAPPRLSAVL